MGDAFKIPKSHSKAFPPPPPETLQSGGRGWGGAPLRQQLRVRQNWVAKCVGLAVCVQVKTTRAFSFFNIRCLIFKSSVES